jgi:hypothetical protein
METSERGIRNAERAALLMFYILPVCIPHSEFWLGGVFAATERRLRNDETTELLVAAGTPPT